MNIYQDRLMDYYRYPRNRGTLATPDFSSDEHNPSCGDSVCMQGIIKDGIIMQIVFDGRGCVISQAAASMLAEQCIGKTFHEVLLLTPTFMIELVGIELGPTRLKCALLSLQALHTGLHKK